MKLIYQLCVFVLGTVCFTTNMLGQIDVAHVISIGRNALYFNDYVVSIGYFNQAIDTRPWLADPYFYRSVAKISLEDYKGAELDATLCIERNPFISKAYLVRGIAYQNLNELESAIQDYKKGLELAPDNIGMRLNLSLAQMRLKQYDESEQTLAELLRYAPRHKEAYSLRANIALERGDTILAESRIEEAIQVDSLLAMPYRLKAQIAYNRGDYLTGIGALGKAIDLEPDDDNLYTHRGIMYYRSNKLREAMADYNKALDLSPVNRVALINRALLRQMVGESVQSIADWDKVVSLEPKNYIARYNRAILAERLGQGAKALADLDVVLAQYPSFFEGFILRSEIRKKMGDRKGAERDYWHAWDLQQNKGYRTAAHATSRSNKTRQTRQATDESINKYNMLIEQSAAIAPNKLRYSSASRGRVQDREVQIEPQGLLYLTYFDFKDPDGKPQQNGATYYANLIDAFNKMYVGEYRLRLQSRAMPLDERQIEWLREQLRREAHLTDPNYYIYRGVVHSLLQDYEQAIADFDRAIALDAKLALAYFARSLAHYRGRQAEMARHREPSLAREVPAQTSAGSPMQMVDPIKSVSDLPKSSLQRTASVLTDLNRVIELDPTFAYAYYNRALLYTQTGESDAAIADYNKALKLQPRLAEAYYNLGLLLLSRGKTAEGIANLSRAGELGLYEAYNIIKRMNQ